jgi:DNA-3-methyladenine glycosylase I
MKTKIKIKTRCAWTANDPLLIHYHDEEWGVPVHDDRLLFEFIILEGMQAGLSWLTILKKRENYRRSFDNFESKLIATYGKRQINSLLEDAGIIRNRLKIESIITNANALLKLNQQCEFSDYIWQFVKHRQIKNRWETRNQVPAKTEISEAMSKDLKKRGFKFVGSTICYAFMQAVGMVNDHTKDCFRYKEINKISKK